MNSAAFRCRRWTLAALACLMTTAATLADDLALLPPTLGASELYVSDGRSGLALAGHDPVSYWTDAAARLGTADEQLVWAGLGWRFLGPANRAAFSRDPESFAPRLGGYDAPAVAAGFLTPSDPRIFAVVSGRLYLFRTEEGRSAFLADAGAPGRAEAHWPGLKDGLVRR